MASQDDVLIAGALDQLRAAGGKDALVEPELLEFDEAAWMMLWVEIVSLGNVARSTSSTRWPWCASSMAVVAPAHRAPTTMATYMDTPASALPTAIAPDMQPSALAASDVARKWLLPPAVSLTGTPS